MGKKFRKKIQIKNCVSPVKERNKIRNSILQVFKSRLQSPGKGGALLVGKSAASPLFIGKNRNIELQTLHSSSNSDFDSDFSSDYLMAKKKKAKCKRKTTKSNSLKIFDNPKMKHIKITEMDSSHSVTGTSSENHSEQKISFITQSRVTKCLGLFNRGRKSDKIARVPISMPESVQNKTNEDLKRVLNIKSTTSDNDSSEEDGANLSNMVPIKVSPSTIMKTSIHEAEGNPCHGKVTQKIPAVSSVHESKSFSTRGERDTIFTMLTIPTALFSQPPAELPSPSNVSCITVSSNISSCSDMEENLPKTPPIKEIASEMLSSLYPKRALFNRNIRRERFNELQKLLMQSLLSSSPCGTIEKTKSAAMISAPKSFIKSTSLASQVQTTNEIEIAENSMNLSGINDAKSLLIQNDIHMKLDKNLHPKSMSVGKAPEIDVSFEKLDEVAFNYNFDNQNKHFTLKSATLNMQPHCDTQLIGHAGDYARLKTDELKFMTCKKFFQYQQTENNKCISSCSFVANESESRGNLKSAPDFSGDYVSPTGSTMKKKQIYQTHDSLDFLEYLDQVDKNSTTDASSFWDSHKFYAWNKTAVFNDTSSDSENSPVWVPLFNLPPPPTKPCLDSIPSPPEKLYPRKLY